ncbi:DUF1826 domain-containing protein [Ferrovibrio terrae]|uniref:DUF1826 domain-containing protein n=1 Tax=Ferrovibrio terrae TaxID=2594003 RepID=UPI003137D713
MTQHQATLQALLGPAPAVLEGIHHPGVNLAVWTRSLSPCLQLAATQRIHGGATPLCLYVEPGEAAGRLPDLLPSAALAADIAYLAEQFLRISGSPRAHVELEVLHHDACRYFHVDHVGLRLLCSYVGPGTEWLSEDNVNRTALGTGNNAAVIRDPRRVHRLETGWAGLFRGEAAAPDRAIVHRSPPIRQNGERRLLLRIDVPGPHIPE